MTSYTTKIAKIYILQEFFSLRLEKEANDISLEIYIGIEFRINGFVDSSLSN